MKKLAIIALCAWLALLPLAALGEITYPASQGSVTDLANVLSENTVEDIDELSARYESAVDGKLYVVTRHFLGGKDIKNYAQSLFDAWELQENDMLFLLVIGEESYALQLGETAQKALPNEMAATYLSTYFHADYMARRYDAAVAVLLPQAAKRVASAEGETLSDAGLFGAAEESKTPASFIQDLDGMFSTLLIGSGDNAAPEERNILQEDKSSGISIWKIILVIIILRTIFKRKKRKRYNFGHHPYR